MHSLQHRHLVVAPFLLLALALGVHGTSSSTVIQYSRAEVLSVAEEGDPELFLHPSGAPGVVLPGGVLDLAAELPTLTEGSIILGKDAPVRMKVADIQILTAGGSIHVTAHAGAVTVAALTAPALVTSGDQRILVPIGMQWRSYQMEASTGDSIALWALSRGVSALPGHFIEDHHSLQQWMYDSTPDLLPASRDEIPEPPAEGPLQFTVASYRERTLWEEQVRGALRSALQTGNEISVRTLTEDSTYRSALTSLRGRWITAALLLSDDRTVALQQLLLPLLIEDQDLWLLLSIHPRASTVAWTLAPPDDPASVRERTLAFPFSDTGTAGVAEITWQRWAETMGALMGTHSNPDAAASETVLLYGPLAQAREAAGLPERARLLRGALRAVTSGRALLPEAQELLVALDALDRVNTTALPSSSQASTSSLSSQASLSAAPAPALPVEEGIDTYAVEARARAFHFQAGAAFSIETRFIPLSSTVVQVENIVFPGSSSDRTFSYLLDLERQVVGNITERSTVYPYALAWDAFASWAKR